MQKYSVMLVDDEELVFQIMMKKMDWDAMGFEVVGFANNGIEALDMAEELLPDVVMTDIKMPYMDGLALGRKLKERYPNIKIIILSGFDEFEYAKEAVRIEVEEYLLKPIDGTELKNVFERVRTTLDREVEERRDIDMLKEHYIKSLPILQENFYISLLEGRLTPSNVEKYASDYQIPLDNSLSVVSVFKVSYQGKNGVEVEVTPFMLLLSVQRLIEESIKDEYKSQVILYLGEVVVISQLDDKTQINAYTDTLDRICKHVYRACKARVTAGIGLLCDNPVQLGKSYKGARIAASYRFFYGDMRAINIAEIDVDSRNHEENTIDDSVRRIVRHMRQPDKEKLEEVINDFLKELEGARLSLSEYRVVNMKLVVAITDFMKDYHLDPDTVTTDGIEIDRYMLGLESAESLKSFLVDTCTRLQDLVSDRRNSTSLSFVTKAEDFVKANYGNKDVSIEVVCSYLNVSAAYFSTVFKKTTGKTFINYLTEYRMEQAVKLLEESDGKTYEIADMVGYSDPNYFSYVFKKQFGVSPVKYKQNLENRD